MKEGRSSGPSLLLLAGVGGSSDSQSGSQGQRAALDSDEERLETVHETEKSGGRSEATEVAAVEPLRGRRQGRTKAAGSRFSMRAAMSARVSSLARAFFRPARARRSLY